jgi:FMN phosphatase YigB (HAD superfamily)
MALEQVGVRPEQAVFVGHKAYELEGARSVGMKTVAFNYEKHAVADYYIKDFADLLGMPFLKLEEPQEFMYENGD